MFCVRVPSITVVSKKLKERWQSQNDTRALGQSVEIRKIKYVKYEQK